MENNLRNVISVMEFVVYALSKTQNKDKTRTSRTITNKHKKLYFVNKYRFFFFFKKVD